MAGTLTPQASTALYMTKLARHFRSSMAGCLTALLLAVLMTALQDVSAQTGVMNIGNAGSYKLSRAFTVLEDPGAALTLDEVLTPASLRPVAR